VRPDFKIHAASRNARRATVRLAAWGSSNGMKTLSPSNSGTLKTARKPSRTSSSWTHLTEEHRARLKEIFSRGVWYLRTVRETIHKETGLRIRGSVRLHNIFMALSGRAIGSENPESNFYRLNEGQRNQVRKRWLADPLISYREMTGWIADTFGIRVTANAIYRWWQKEVAPFVLPPLPTPPMPLNKTVELTVTVKDGDQVEGVTTLALKLWAPGAPGTGGVR
jgi:hypothetical protein